MALPLRLLAEQSDPSSSSNATIPEVPVLVLPRLDDTYGALLLGMSFGLMYVAPLPSGESEYRASLTSTRILGSMGSQCIRRTGTSVCTRATFACSRDSC